MLLSSPPARFLYQPDLEQTDRRGNPLLRPLGFHSQTFNKAEQNYPIYDRELLAIIRGLRNWRHLLRNTTHPVMVSPITPTSNTIANPKRLAHESMGISWSWPILIFNWLYKPGNTNKADELSRRPDMAPEDEDELVIVLPNHLFCPPGIPIYGVRRNTYQNPRTMTPTLDTSRTEPTILDTSLKNE